MHASGEPNAEILRRIKEAKEYKRDRGNQADNERQRLDEKVASFGESAAAREEQVLSSALADLQQQGSAAAETGPSPQLRQPSNERKAATDAASLRLAAMQRIEAARKYSGTTATAPSSGQGSTPPAAGSAPSPTAPSEQEEAVEWGQSGIGSAEQAAPFIREIVQREASSSSISQDLSAEQFTLAKEKEQRARGAEIITIDSGEGASATGGAYRPKVATWGVFPRPANISREYGGGRTLRPGEALEPEAVTLARKKRVTDALSSYKKSAGLEVDPAAEASAKEAYCRGVELMQRGQLAAALVPFEEVVNLIPMRTRVGGEATLQRAICLDSLGRTEEAMALYKQVARHTAPGVSKKAKQMLFGFTSMDYLKTHSISYGVQRGAYDEYFTKLTGQWNNTYSADADADDGSLTVATVVATAVMMAPLVLVGVKLGARLLK